MYINLNFFYSCYKNINARGKHSKGGGKENHLLSDSNDHSLTIYDLKRFEMTFHKNILFYKCSLL